MEPAIPTIGDLEAALKRLHDPQLLCTNPLATLPFIHTRITPERRAADHTELPLPWVYGFELAMVLREQLLQLTTHTSIRPLATSRAQLYARILQLRYGENLSWQAVAERVGLAPGHIQNKLKRPALQMLLGVLLDIPLVQPVRPALRTIAVTHNLPATGKLIGRNAEVALVVQKLKHRRLPIIEIGGIGGVGKSALARTIGWMALDQGLFDAVVWLSAQEQQLLFDGTTNRTGQGELRSLSNLLETIARVLGARQALLHHAARRQQVVEMLGSGRFAHGVLLIIDNYEMLASDEQAQIADFLFHELPYPSQALITSRHAEYTIQVGTQKFSTQVYLDRMPAGDTAACLDYFLTLQGLPASMTPAVKQQIVDVSDGVPLALLWLLGQLHYNPRSLHTLLARLPAANQGEGAGQRNNPNRLLLYIFDHSFSLLARHQSARALLLALAIFREGVPITTLVATAGVPAVAADDSVELLLRLSLIVREPTVEPRYSVLELTRSYLTRLIDEPQRAEFFERAASYYVRHGSRKERANMLPLLEWTIATSRHNLTIGLFDALTSTHLLESDTQVHDCAAYGAAVVAATRASGMEERADWYTIFAVGWVLVVRREMAAAQALLEDRLAVATQRGWYSNQALACSTLGLLYNDTEEGERSGLLLDMAHSYLEQAATLWEALDRQDWLAIVFARLGTVARQRGDYPAALAYYDRSEAVYRALNNQPGRVSVLGRRAYALLQRYRSTNEGDPREIERLLLVALDLSEQQGNRWGLAANQLRYAEFLELQGDLPRALSYAERAAALFMSISDRVRAQQAATIAVRLRQARL